MKKRKFVNLLESKKEKNLDLFLQENNSFVSQLIQTMNLNEEQLIAMRKILDSAISGSFHNVFQTLEDHSIQVQFEDKNTQSVTSIMEESFFNEFFFKGYFTKDELFFDLPDGINAPEDYENIIQELFDITNGLLVLNQFNGSKTENNIFVLDLLINNKEYHFEFAGSYQVDAGLIEHFNKILQDEFPGQDKKFTDVGDGMVYDFAIAFIDKDTEVRLAENGKIWRSEDWMFNARSQNN